MPIGFQWFVSLAGLASLAAVFVLTPEFAAHVLSADGELEPHTITEIQAWRALVGLVGVALLAGSLAWRLLRRASIRQRIEADYSRWQDPLNRLTPADRHWLRSAMVAVWLAAGVAVLTAVLSFWYEDRRWFQLLAWENGVIESIQAACLLLAGLVLLPLAWRAWRRDGIALSGLGFLFALLLIVAAGEEISWGQHWLGFATPEQLERMNVQGEFNFHNIGSYWINHLLILFFLVYLGLWPALAVFYPQLRYLLDRLSMPVVPLALVPIAVLSLPLDDHDVVTRLWGDPPWRLSEGRELLFAVSMLVVTLLMRRYRRRLQ